MSGKFLKDRVYRIALNPKYDGYQRGLAGMVRKVFDKNKGLGSSDGKCKWNASSRITQTSD